MKIDWIKIFILGMLLSIPTIIVSAFYFDNGNLLWLIVLPIIFLMAG